MKLVYIHQYNQKQYEKWSHGVYNTTQQQKNSK